MDEIKVGDRVRSYDFADRDDCWVEGVVVEIGTCGFLQGFDRYKIEVQRSTMDGDTGIFEQAPGHFVYPPINGTPKGMGGVCNFVKLIEKATPAP